MLAAEAQRAGARTAFARGFREIAPVGAGIFAWGLVTGVAMMDTGLSLAQALAMTFLAYAGAAQLAVLPLIGGGAPVWVAVLTALVVNLRFVIYSLALRGTFAPETAPRRAALGYFTGDITFVKFMALRESDPSLRHAIAWFAGAAACNWVAWQVGSLAGIFGAKAIPPDSGLALAGTLALVTLIIPLCTRAPALAGVVVAGAVAVLAHGVPMRLGLVLAVICGVATAVTAEARLVRR
jgi:predicted branched-subunit amino acid permease